MVSAGGFNSLQTGKCIQSFRFMGVVYRRFRTVSIPFKRESVFKVTISVDGKTVAKMVPFQFPSNGKVYSKYYGNRRIEPGLVYVSIPFKRESVFKEDERKAEYLKAKEFQFPSNGKVYSKTKRGESMASPKFSFNSLQTGKCIQS